MPLAWDKIFKQILELSTLFSWAEQMDMQDLYAQ